MRSERSSYSVGTGPISRLASLMTMVRSMVSYSAGIVSMRSEASCTMISSERVENFAGVMTLAKQSPGCASGRIWVLSISCAVAPAAVRVAIVASAGSSTGMMANGVRRVVT